MLYQFFNIFQLFFDIFRDKLCDAIKDFSLTLQSLVIGKRGLMHNSITFSFLKVKCESTTKHWINNETSVPETQNLRKLKYIIRKTANDSLWYMISKTGRHWYERLKAIILSRTRIVLSAEQLNKHTIWQRTGRGFARRRVDQLQEAKSL